jgi:hypothetical protein
MQVADRGRHAQIDVLTDDRATILFHRTPTGAESLYAAFDVFPCIGYFQVRRPPNRNNGLSFIWPYCAVDSAGRLHIVATHSPLAGDSMPFMYTRSNDEGYSWTTPQRVDTLEYPSPIIVASRVSRKVAVVYPHSFDESQSFMSDILYVQSDDGLYWDFANGKINVTEYAFDDDSLVAHFDFDAVFDDNDNLHVVWMALRTPISWPDPHYLYHYSSQDGAITEIGQFDIVPNDSCQFPPERLGLANVSLSASANGGIFVLYTRFDTTDCSRIGEANGELIAQASYDGGSTWGPPTDITNTRTPDCAYQQCASELWPSTAEVADDFLHIFYVGYNGGSDFWWPSADIPMMYYEFSVRALGATDGLPTPANIALLQNYPNPFNSNTSIEFDLIDDSHIELAVFDVAGARVATLARGSFKAGKHQARWDCGAAASGIYFYRLRAGGITATRKMTLLK